MCSWVLVQNTNKQFRSKELLSKITSFSIPFYRPNSAIIVRYFSKHSDDILEYLHDVSNIPCFAKVCQTIFCHSIKNLQELFFSYVLIFVKIWFTTLLVQLWLKYFPLKLYWEKVGNFLMWFPLFTLLIPQEKKKIYHHWYKLT